VAAKVGIGQPPLSQQIKDLEIEVGALLFHRLAHGAELTPAGEAFLVVVKGMPALADMAAKAARRAARGETGSLRVGFTASSAFSAIVPGTIRAFGQAYPEVDLTLEEANTTRLVVGLQNGSLDAVFLRPGALGGEGFQVRLLSEEPMVVVLPANHRLAAEREVDLKDLRADPFLLFPRLVGPAVYDSIIGACQKAGFDPVIGQTAPHMASVVTLVAAELGVSIVPASMGQLQITGAVYCPIAGEAPVARLALAHRRGETSPIVRNFVARAVA
jgi:DNA-binding transcriptional LysR family regulator